MFGELFRLGEQKVRGGVFARWYNAGGASRYAGSVGVAAAVIKANWALENGTVTINTLEDVKLKIGSGKGADVVSSIFKGGASTVIVSRIGTGGSQATLSLEGDSSAEVLDLFTKYPTSRGFSVTVRSGLDVTEKEFLLFEDDRQIEKFVVPAGNEESADLAKEINEKSQYLTATSSVESELATVMNEKLTGGSDPTATAEDYTNALSVIERKSFDGIAVDTEDVAVHASIRAFVNRKLREGYRVLGAVGQKATESFETRKSESKALNDFAMMYVGNGFVEGGRNVDGAEAAGRVLGMAISSSYKSSLTKKSISGSTGIYGELTVTEYNAAVESGMIVFSPNPDGLAQIDYGINTLVSAEGEEVDEGWKKVRRVKTRFELIDRITYSIAKAQSQETDNNDDGRQHLITIANGIIEEMIREGGLESGAMIVDPSNAPEGDSAWFKFDNLVDLDGIEKVYLAFGFKY